MRSRSTLVLVFCTAVGLPALHVACTDDDPAPAQPGVDAGGFDATAADSTVSADGTAKDTGTQQEAGPQDSGTDVVADAGTDAAIDAADASLGVGLYVHASGNVYLIDPDDAGVALI